MYPIVEQEGDDAVPADLGAADVVLALVFVASESTGSPDGRLVPFVGRDSAREDEPIIDARPG